MEFMEQKKDLYALNNCMQRGKDWKWEMMNEMHTELMICENNQSNTLNTTAVEAVPFLTSRNNEVINRGAAEF